jgi:hypothetical protein
MVMSDDDGQPEIPKEILDRMKVLEPFGVATQELINHMHAGGLTGSEAFYMMISGACAVLARAPTAAMLEELPHIATRMATLIGVYRAMSDRNRDVETAREIASAAIARHMKGAKP